jgi:hypothetical protein
MVDIPRLFMTEEFLLKYLMFGINIWYINFILILFFFKYPGGRADAWLAPSPTGAHAYIP